jgi:3-hydroxyisobutyrate dehydrogenase-like beta-hydroxyacid dehydrogenase
MDVGFVGVGQMGGGMARNLLAAGHNVRVWDRTAAAAEALRADGAEPVRTAAEAVAGDAVLTMVTNDAAVREVFLTGGLLERAPAGLVHVLCSTISVGFAQELETAHAAHGVGYVGAPVFGRPERAAAGHLNIVVGGASAAVERVQPLLDAKSERTWPVGEEPHKANVVKMAYNLLMGGAIEALAEAAALGRAYGIAPADLLGVCTSTGFTGLVHEGYGDLIARGAYEPAGFSTTLGLKDIRMALAAGDAVNVPMPLVSGVRDALMEAMATGHADEDWAVLGEVALRRSGQAGAR